MNDQRIEGYARGLFEIARAEGTLDKVEDELFRFARAYESSDSLRSALADETTVTLKRLVRERGRFLLRAANADYEDIKPDRLEAQGVVRGVIRLGLALNA